MGNSPNSIKSVSLSIFVLLLLLLLFYFIFFNIWNVATFKICEKLLMKLHPDTVCIAGSKQHIDNPNTEANTCIGIYL